MLLSQENIGWRNVNQNITYNSPLNIYKTILNFEVIVKSIIDLLHPCPLDKSSLSFGTVNMPKNFWLSTSYKWFLIANDTGRWKEDISTLSMLRLLLSKAQELKNLWKSSKPYHLGIHWKALIEYSQMSTHLPGFRLFFSFFHIILYW